MISFIKKRILTILIIFNALFSIGMSFAFWASSISGNSVISSGEITIGQWGIPIFTAQEFYDFATKTDSLATDQYYLANDINFSGFSWVYNQDNNKVVFHGQLNGNDKTLSNLTILNSSSTYKYLGLFPRMDGGSVRDVTFNNVHLVTLLSGSSQRAGLIAADVYNKNVNTIKNITIMNSSVQGNNLNGVGGLVGSVQTNNTVLNIENIKATEFKIFNKAAYVGGLIGRVSNSSVVNISDVDFQGEIYSHTRSGNSGGIIGQTKAGNTITVNRVIVDAVFKNTLVTDINYFNRYSERYIGGFVGYNLTKSSDININDSFFTGSLFNQSKRDRSSVGTVLGRGSKEITISNTYYAYVSYRDAADQVSYTETGQTGQMATVVSKTSMPTKMWWDNFYTTRFDGANDLWAQDLNGRPYLVR